jgi:hypothetical protein
MATAKDVRLSQPTRDALYLLNKAMVGDIVIAISPATVGQTAGSTAWTRTVTVTMKTAASETHDWFNKAIATGVSIAYSSSAGVATIPSTTLTFVDGVATVVISSAALTWAGGDTDTLTIANVTFNGATVTGGTSVGTFS